MKIKEKINKFNDFIADRLSYVLSIMATFYIITLLVAIPLFYAQPTSVVAWASYLCSVVFQGLALPVLGYTARKSGDKADKMMNDMYKMTEKIEKLTELIEKQQEHLHEDVEEIIDLEKSKRNKNK
jgi:low affinity Fe/Cu permease